MAPSVVKTHKTDHMDDEEKAQEVIAHVKQERSKYQELCGIAINQLLGGPRFEPKRLHQLLSNVVGTTLHSLQQQQVSEIGSRGFDYNIRSFETDNQVGQNACKVVVEIREMHPLRTIVMTIEA